VGQRRGAGEAGPVREGGVAVHGFSSIQRCKEKRRVAVRTTLLQGRPPSGRRPGPAPGPPNMLGGGNDTTARCGGQASRQGRKSCTPERPRRSSGRHGTGRPIGGADGKRGPGGQTGVPHWRGPAAGQAGGGGA